MNGLLAEAEICGSVSTPTATSGSHADAFGQPLATDHQHTHLPPTTEELSPAQGGLAPADVLSQSRHRMDTTIGVTVDMVEDRRLRREDEEAIGTQTEDEVGIERTVAQDAVGGRALAGTQLITQHTVLDGGEHHHTIFVTEHRQRHDDEPLLVAPGSRDWIRRSVTAIVCLVHETP